MNGAIRESGPVLAERDWEPIVLGPKEGLALINGVQYITAVAAACLARAARLATAADVVASVSLQAFCTSKTFFHELYHSLTAHQERRDVAVHLSTLVEGGNHWSLPQANRSMQDPYSFRCIPQVHGAVRQALRFATQTVKSEINSVATIHSSSRSKTRSCLVAIFMASPRPWHWTSPIAVSELSSVSSERRSYQLLSGERGLPDFLVPNPGLHFRLHDRPIHGSGLGQPEQSAGHTVVDRQHHDLPAARRPREYGWYGRIEASRHCGQLRDGRAVELLLAAQAAELQEGMVLSESARELVTELRTVVPFLDVDRVVALDIAVAKRFLSLHASKWFDRQKSR